MVSILNEKIKNRDVVVWVMLPLTEAFSKHFKVIRYDKYRESKGFE